MSTRSGRGPVPVRGYNRRRKTGLEIDLNQEPGGENRELEGPSTQVEPQQVQAAQQQQAVEMPQPAQPATIDVEAIVDDDVVESSPRAFAEAKNNARRNRQRTVVDVDSALDFLCFYKINWLSDNGSLVKGRLGATIELSPSDLKVMGSSLVISY
ncbi:hypothetical protein PIB30_037006 [Stylosanthes scabra]|uniref:Uncharacterized protein n=1 Tax=Stylosanthes scabra TaxID=79078 RepID=A0ABU6QD66_9FABA|nr:hypothetical protein [Stylosanthes scabra]